MDAEDIISLTDSVNVTLIMLIGPAGSGKHNLANTLIEFSKVKAKIVSTNKIKKDICGDIYDQSKNKEVFSQVYKTIADELDNRNDVIYVSTNCKVQYRKKIIDICKYKCDKIIGVVFTKDLISCMHSSNPKASVQIEEDYVDLRKRPPHVFEGFDAIITID